jgi:hypothetical protein
MTIVPAPGNSPADGSRWSFSGAYEEVARNAGTDFRPLPRPGSSYPVERLLEIGFNFQSMLSVSTVARESAQGRC